MKSLFKVILLLLIPLALIAAYSLSSYEFGCGDFSLEKADLSPLVRQQTVSTPQEAPDSIALAVLPEQTSADSMHAAVDVMPDTNRTVSRPVSTPTIRVAAPDSTKFRILFFGDSMLEGLAKRMCDYTMENGYDLTSVIWYSSSTKLWAETDTLQFFLRQVQPDYVVLCLGSNELFVRDLDKRDRYIGTLVGKLAGYPFVWISPPNWKEDTGINQLIIDHVGMGRYFDSRHLSLERSSDHAHPTHAAAAQWMDTIAVWMSSSAAAHPLRMDPPTENRKRKFRQYMLKPVR